MYLSNWSYVGIQETLMPPDCRWMEMFKMRWLAEVNFNVYYIDIGYKKTYFGKLRYG